VKVLFLPMFGPEGASSRFRVYQFMAPLRAAGWIVKAEPPPRPVSGALILYLLRACLSARRADVVFLQKRPLGRGIEWLWRANPCLVYDLDDAIYVSPPATTIPQQELARVQTNLAHTVSLARLVIVGNQHLAERLRPLAQRLTILPTVVDVERFRPAPRPAGRPVVVGWIGNQENLVYLEGLAPVWEGLARALPGQFILRVVSSRPARLPATVPVAYRPWRLEQEVADLQEFDIGLMPLVNDEWSRGKCGFKAIQYMAVGAAVVLSPVGVNREIVTDGVSGLWAETPEAWFTALHRLITDAGLRQRLATAGRQVVVAQYSLQVTLPKLITLLQEVAGRK